MARHRVIPVEEIAPDKALVQQYGRAVRALLARLAPVGTCDEIEVLKAIQRRAQPRLDQIENEKGGYE